MCMYTCMESVSSLCYLKRCPELIEKLLSTISRGGCATPPVGSSTNNPGQPTIVDIPLLKRRQVSSPPSRLPSCLRRPLLFIRINGKSNWLNATFFQLSFPGAMIDYAINLYASVLQYPQYREALFPGINPSLPGFGSYLSLSN